MNVTEFIAWETASRDSIDVKRSYIDACGGDLVTGVLLSQIVFWHLPDLAGKQKLRVKLDDGHFWLAKGRADWWVECRVTPKQFDRAYKILLEYGYVLSCVKRFAGNPTLHTRVNWPVFLPAIIKIINDQQAGPLLLKGKYGYSPKVNNGNTPNGNNEIDERETSSTETTDTDHAENTTEESEGAQSARAANGLDNESTLFPEMIAQADRNTSAGFWYADQTAALAEGRQPMPGPRDVMLLDDENGETETVSHLKETTPSARGSLQTGVNAELPEQPPSRAARLSLGDYEHMAMVRFDSKYMQKRGQHPPRNRKLELKAESLYDQFGSEEYEAALDGFYSCRKGTDAWPEQQGFSLHAFTSQFEKWSAPIVERGNNNARPANRSASRPSRAGQEVNPNRPRPVIE